jgi:predicted transcriptional regulator
MRRKMTNYEEVYYKFMPAFKSYAARLMVRDIGITQQRTAHLLGTTQAAINGYLSERLVKNSGKIQKAIDKKEIRHFIENIIEGNEQAAQRSVCKICQTHKKFNCEIMVK